MATVYLAVAKPLFGQATPVADRPVGHVLHASGFLFVASIAVLVLAWTAGLLVRSIRDSREVRRREDVANRERALVEYRYAVEQERNRIARDMHDVVAHSLAVVIAQADGARFAARTDPEAADRRARHDRGVRPRCARRRAACCSPSSATTSPPRPQPVLDDLDGLLERRCARPASTCASPSTGERLQLGTGHQIAVYRIVQEGLTNALRHGDVAAPVDLRLALGRPRGVELEVRQRDAPGCRDGRVARLRHGIPGMRERAQLAGGSLSAERGRRRDVPGARAHPGAGEAARMSGIRVALVDDQALFRAGVRMLVESQADLEVVGRGGRRRRRRRRSPCGHAPDVMLMDVRMPLLDGIAATERDPRRRRPRRAPPRVHRCSPRSTSTRTRRGAIRAGASGFVLKDADPEFLLAAIRTVHQGNQVIAATATRELFAHVGRRQRPARRRPRRGRS